MQRVLTGLAVAAAVGVGSVGCGDNPSSQGAGTEEWRFQFYTPVNEHRGSVRVGGGARYPRVALRADAQRVLAVDIAPLAQGLAPESVGEVQVIRDSLRGGARHALGFLRPEHNRREAVAF